MRGTPAENNKVVGWIARHAKLKGKPPTAREVAEHFDIAHTTAVNLLSRLEASGEITRPSRFNADHRTNRQREILAFIRSFCDENVVPPSQREIAAGLDMAVSQVNRHVGIMVAQGLLEVGPGNRAVRITGSRMVIPEVTL